MVAAAAAGNDVSRGPRKKAHPSRRKHERAPTVEDLRDVVLGLDKEDLDEEQRVVLGVLEKLCAGACQPRAGRRTGKAETHARGRRA